MKLFGKTILTLKYKFVSIMSIDLGKYFNLNFFVWQHFILTFKVLEVNILHPNAYFAI